MTHVLSSFILTAIGPPNYGLGDKMEKEKKCKTCKRDGIPSDETECGRCEKIRQLYQIRKEIAEWHAEKVRFEDIDDRLDRFEFDDEVLDRWPYLKEQHMDGMWYLDHTIKRNLDRLNRSLEKKPDSEFFKKIIDCEDEKVLKFLIKNDRDLKKII